jgi:hypothetical protein
MTVALAVSRSNSKYHVLYFPSQVVYAADARTNVSDKESISSLYQEYERGKNQVL